MTVNIRPMPGWARKTKFPCMPPPIFPDGQPSRDDIQLALALFAELDEQSQQWYGGESCRQRLQARLNG